jgi:tetratricopeptide (TPR) repeat protein
MKTSKSVLHLCSLISFLILPAFFLSAAWAAEDEALKHFLSGNEYSQKGDFPKAIEAYQKSIKADKTKPETHYNLGNVYVASAIGKTAQADIEKAIKEYKTAIELNPLNPDYHRNLGYAYALDQKGDLAKGKYEELKKISPAHAEELMTWIKRDNQKK